MGETVIMRWIAPGSQIVFELTINREAHRDNVPSQASISCGSDASTAIKVPIALSKRSVVDAKFRSGHYVKGFIRQTPPSRTDGVTETRIVGEFHYGVNREDHVFDGVLASVPVRNP